MTKKRVNKKLSEEELKEVESFIYRNNKEEEKFISTLQVEFKCKTENQKKLIQSIKQNEITIVSGLAGSGKTYLTCGESLRLIKTSDKYKRIVLIKSITTLKDEDLGSLPGDVKEKMDPYMQSFLDNLNKLVGRTMVNKLRELGVIEILPIAFARGRSIDNSIIIIDEAQNISINNMRTLMTRLGYDSKMIILGDVKQKDIKNKKESSLEIIMDRFKDINKFGVVELRNPEDVVRNPIINTIENIFDQLEDDKSSNRQLLKD
jgi:phosphate starvation-inducible PhoH-like protein